EKSLHGKYFEKLILGSLFTIMGFEYKEKIEEGLNAKCFTLSTRADDRESDATLVFNGKAIRVDIGFIGRGNTEISLDKVSRFRRMDDIG
ncbi:CfrBI family restriction endonuclease, partial [Escherichia coli]|nr:CfrBI family restriction endonuclease [Escherichia coli]